MALRGARKYPRIGEIPSIFLDNTLPSGVKEITPKPLAVASSDEDPYPWRKWYEGAWDICMKAMGYNYKYGEFNPCVVFGYVRDNRFIGNGSTACFADLNRAGSGIQYVLSFLMDYEDTEEQRFYLDWLVNRSPWANIFPEKDLDIIRDNGLIADANYPSNLVVGGLIASRAFGEKENSIPIFKSLCEHGVEPNLAYVLALFGYPRVDSISWTANSCGHSAIAHEGFSKESLHRFISGETYQKNTRKNLYESPSYYTYDERNNIFGIWGDREGNWLQSYIIQNYKYGDGVKKSDNPFAQINATNQDEYGVAITKMADLSHKIMKEISVEEDK